MCTNARTALLDASRCHNSKDVNCVSNWTPGIRSPKTGGEAAWLRAASPSAEADSIGIHLVQLI